MELCRKVFNDEFVPHLSATQRVQTTASQMQGQTYCRPHQKYSWFEQRIYPDADLEYDWVNATVKPKKLFVGDY